MTAWCASDALCFRQCLVMDEPNKKKPPTSARALKPGIYLSPNGEDEVVVGNLGFIPCARCGDIAFLQKVGATCQYHCGTCGGITLRPAFGRRFVRKKN